MYDGLCSHAMALLVTGAFLPGMALALGAGNFVIGLLASLAPMSQMMQIPAILLIERVGLRKLLTVFFAMLSRIALVGAAFVPFMSGGSKEIIFFILMVVFFVCGSIAGCSWSSWIKDIVPGESMGVYFARRLSLATMLGVLMTIAAGFGIDSLTVAMGDASRAYGVIFLVAAITGIIGAKTLTHVPEPRMPSRDAEAKWLASLLEPLKDPNFRRLLAFSASWSFTVIMSGAFMAVYMLERIGLPMSTVILLAVLSQVTNVYFFKVWGAISDRYSNKSVLRVSLPLFILVILLYPFTTMPERYFLSLPLLVLIHILGGISTAGFNLCAGNIALKLAPHGKATSYLGANAFCSGLAATIAPVLGGLLGSFFATREISIKFFYNPDITSVDEVMSIPALSFRGLDFVFFIAAIVGVYAMHRLSLVEEEGTVSEGEVREQVLQSIRTTLGSAYGLSLGMRRMTAFPYEVLLRRGRSKASASFMAARNGLEKTKRFTTLSPYKEKPPDES